MSQGYFFITEVEDVKRFVDTHRQTLKAISSSSSTASGVHIDGVYVEYRPDVGDFAHVVSLEHLRHLCRKDELFWVQCIECRGPIQNRGHSVCPWCKAEQGIHYDTDDFSSYVSLLHWKGECPEYQNAELDKMMQEDNRLL